MGTFGGKIPKGQKGMKWGKIAGQNKLIFVRNETKRYGNRTKVQYDWTEWGIG